jgi:hypothetical protein
VTQCCCATFGSIMVRKQFSIPRSFLDAGNWKSSSD